MEQYHYVCYEQPVGEHLKYLVWAQGRPVAGLASSSAPRLTIPILGRLSGTGPMDCHRLEPLSRIRSVLSSYLSSEQGA